jgi:hypothetical protein
MDRTLDPRISGGGSFSLASVASIRAFLESVCDELPALRGFHRSTYCTNDVRARVLSRNKSRASGTRQNGAHFKAMAPGRVSGTPERIQGESALLHQDPLSW